VTVSSQTNKAQYIGDGSTTAFAVPFPFLDNSHLVVVLTDIATQVDTVQTITTHYTLSGAGTSSGTCTFGTAPPVTKRVTIYRSTPINQLLDLKENDAFSAEASEDAIDKLTMIMIDLKELLSRGVTLDVTSTASPADPTTFTGVSDVFVGLISGAPTAGAHAFVEQEPIAGGTTWQTLSGGRTGTAYALNGCNDDLSGEKVLISQHVDAAGGTAYRFNPPVTCLT
jgi:hypothetical protein